MSAVFQASALKLVECSMWSLEMFDVFLLLLFVSAEENRIEDF